MRWLLLDQTLLCTSDDVCTHSLALHSTHCVHIQVAPILQLRKLRRQEELAPSRQRPWSVCGRRSWWHAPAACCFLRSLNVGLTGITHEARRPPRNCGHPLSTYCKGEVLTHLLRVDSSSHPSMAGRGGTQSGRENKSRL